MFQQTVVSKDYSFNVEPFLLILDQFEQFPFLGVLLHAPPYRSRGVCSPWLEHAAVFIKCPFDRVGVHVFGETQYIFYPVVDYVPFEHPVTSSHVYVLCTNHHALFTTLDEDGQNVESFWSLQLLRFKIENRRLLIFQAFLEYFFPKLGF